MTPQREPSVSISPAQAKAIAQEAYLFGLPLVYIDLSADTMTNVARSESPRAPFNQFAHNREFPDATEKSIVALNVDTLYSIANLDLSGEPIVLSIPEMGKRWWLMQLLDAWNEVFAAPGARTIGEKGGDFAIVGPGWKGRLPDGLIECRSGTSLATVGGRTFTAGKSDYEAAHKLQDRYGLTPLSQWGKPYSPPASVPVKPGVDARTPVQKQILAMTPEGFFNRLTALLPANPPRQADAPIMDRMAELGLVPGLPFSPENLEPEIRDAMEAGVATGQRAMLRVQRGEKVNGWELARDLGRYGTRYVYRAAWTFFARGGNLAEDAIYPMTKVDADDEPLDGSRQYELRFRKADIPPVNDFWSLTLYDSGSFLVPNPLNRHSRGGRDALKVGADGSIVIYIQKQSPGKEEAANWLPAPEGAFQLVLRLYGPKREVVEGKWNPPPVARAY